VEHGLLVGAAGPWLCGFYTSRSYGKHESPQHRRRRLKTLTQRKRIALPVNLNNPNVAADAPETEAAANALERRLEVLTASTEGDLEAAFTTMVRRQAGAPIMMPDLLFFARRALGSPVQTVTPPDFIRSPTYVRRRRAVVMMSEPATGVHRVHRRIMMRP
jgi:hypothetical protein